MGRDQGQCVQPGRGIMNDIAIEELYRDHVLAVRRVLFRMVKCEETAAEIAQEAFVKLLRYEPKGPIQNPRAFLFRIALNAARDRLGRERTRARFTDDGTDIETLETMEADAETTVMARERLRILGDEIDRLPPRCREVFLLSRIEGLTNPEISNRLGISRNMVEKHIIKALVRCRRALKQDWS